MLISYHPTAASLPATTPALLSVTSSCARAQGRRGREGRGVTWRAEGKMMRSQMKQRASLRSLLALV
jgi:hypothetical protein